MGSVEMQTVDSNLRNVKMGIAQMKERMLKFTYKHVLSALFGPIFKIQKPAIHR